MAKQVVKSKAKSMRQAVEAGGGVLRLAPTWVPRAFLTPGRRIKLNPKDIYAYGAHRGGIDERWFASTTPCANENREPDEGLSYVVVNGKRAFTLAWQKGVDARHASIAYGYNVDTLMKHYVSLDEQQVTDVSQQLGQILNEEL